MNPLLVKCPCCEAVLDIDVRTGKVLRINPHDATGGEARFDDIVSTVKAKEGQGSGAFDELTAKVKGREKGLDDAFRDAFERVKETDDGSKPPSPFDFD